MQAADLTSPAGGGRDEVGVEFEARLLVLSLLWPWQVREGPAIPAAGKAENGKKNQNIRSLNQ